VKFFFFKKKYVRGENFFFLHIEYGDNREMEWRWKGKENKIAKLKEEHTIDVTRRMCQESVEGGLCYNP
jgi:hypothetical protein